MSIKEAGTPVIGSGEDTSRPAISLDDQAKEIIQTILAGKAPRAARARRRLKRLLALHPADHVTVLREHLILARTPHRMQGKLPAPWPRNHPDTHRSIAFTARQSRTNLRALRPETALRPGNKVNSASGLYGLRYQEDGNLVLDGPEGPLWASGTDGRGAGVCVMQADGNLVLYGPDDRRIWDSKTENNPGSSLVIQDDGNAVIYRPDGSPVWATETRLSIHHEDQDHVLVAGISLRPAHGIKSANGLYGLLYQGDGNLVLYGPDGPLWASGTQGRGAGVCIMQADGNLVLYGPDDERIWDSGTGNNPGSSLIIQDDGNAVIYRPDGSPVWVNGTL